MAARHALRLSILALPLLVGRPLFAQHAAAPSVGRPIVEVVDELRRTGLPFAYSSTVLRSTLAVTAEPKAADPIELVREILAPHGLTLRLVDGLYVVVRDTPPATARIGKVLVTLRDATTGAALNAHTGWPTTELAFARTGSEPPVAILSERNARRLPGFLSLDLRASRSVPLRIGSLQVFLEISNASGRENPCCVELDLEVDGAGGLLLGQDADGRLPRLATFGARWQF